MTATQHLVLFWVFIVFFMVIGIIAILAIVGVIKTDKKFRNWAVGGFAAAVVGVVIIWAKTQSPQLPLDLYVNLEPPANVKAATFELESGTYEYDEQSSSGKINQAIRISRTDRRTDHGMVDGKNSMYGHDQTLQD